MTDAILARIEARLGAPGLARRLARELPASDLQSLLMAVYAERAHAREPAELLREQAESRFVRPAPLDGRAFHAVESAAWAQLPAGYRVLELSPLAPLGSCSALATVHQNKVVSALRGDVAADCTNTLALEAALARRERERREPRSSERVGLAAHQRVTRAQRFEGPVSFAHFRTLCLVAAARDAGDRRFERDALAEHLAFHTGVIRAVRPAGTTVSVALTVLDERRFGAALPEWIEGPLRRAVGAEVELRLDPERTSGRGYYEGLCFKIHAEDDDGRVELGDGGLVDWTRRLLASRKERCLISGLGSDRLALHRADATT